MISKSKEASSLTEQELIEIAKREWYKLGEVEDKSLITKNVIDNLRISNRDWYHKVLKGVAPECFSKEKALQLLKFDKERFGQKEIKVKDESFEKLMFIYYSAIKELEVKINIMKEQFNYFL
mgnify:CR=1 FL=1